MAPSTSTPRLQRIVCSCAASLLLAATCSACKEDVVTHTRIAKSEHKAAPPQAPPPGMGGGMDGAAGNAVTPPPRPEAATALKWTLPQGWTQEDGSGMRYATIKPTSEGKIEISVVMLPGMAGGELANANRWRGQLGLEPVDEAGLAAIKKALTTKAGPVAVFDFVSDGQQKSRMIAGLLADKDGRTWFLKMVGDEAPVAASQADFSHLLETLHFD